MKKVFVWRNAFICLLGVLLTFAAYQHFWAKQIAAQSTTTTRILLPMFTGSDAGNWSNLLIENTSMDPYGTTPSGPNNAVCEADFYSGGTHYGPFALDVNLPGQVSVWSSTYIKTELLVPLSNSTQVAYIFLTCNFPYAHAQVQFVNSSGVSTYLPGYIIPPNRSFGTGPEQLLQ